MGVFKCKETGTWYVMTRYRDWKGERKQKCKRGLSLNAAIRFPSFLRFSRSVELLMEELAVDPACNGDAAGLSQLFIQLTDELIRIRNRYAKLFRDFIDSHQNFSCHRQNTFLSCFVVDFFCRSIRRTLAGNPFRRCAVFFPLWHARLIACFPGESILWTVIQFGSFGFHPLSPYNGHFFCIC